MSLESHAITFCAIFVYNFEQVGGAVAYLQTGLFLARCYMTLLASSVLIITWLNLR